MRLSDQQIAVFHHEIRRFLDPESYQLYLYGSRAQDQLTGGDIDLVIVTTETGVGIYKKHQLDILVNIKKNPEIGQRRIDLKAITPAAYSTDPFWIIVGENAILI